ncbi:YeiH family protein [Streptomyces sp. NRRL S-340]|uniref:YeiH family protein n=1 Tax=Streptomyces sp. NRRL S-340 TaxID=1463901 RepID=UPI000560CA84|nr:putative sulfate exporter family transporter [Streptomyces sp. NRRL S-340]
MSGRTAPVTRPPEPAPAGTGPSRPAAGAGTRTELPGLAAAAAGVALAWTVHRLLPAVPMLTAAVVAGVVAAHLPRVRTVVRGAARPGLTFAGKRLMRAGVVLLGLSVGLDDVLGLGWQTVVMVVCTVAATFAGTVWLGRRLGLPGDQPLLIATGYSICGASAVGAMSDVSGSEEEDVATAVAMVTLCGTLAIVVLPLLHDPLGLDATQFGRWVGAGVHDVGQVVATAQTAGPTALREAVLVKLMRVAMLAPLVASVGLSLRRARRKAAARTAAGCDGTDGTGGTAGTGTAVAQEARAGARTPVVPLFVVGFLAMVALRSTGLVPHTALGLAHHAQELLLAAALVGLGSAVHLPSLVRDGGRVAALGLCSWIVIAGVSYGGVLLTT